MRLGVGGGGGGGDRRFASATDTETIRIAMIALPRVTMKATGGNIIFTSDNPREPAAFRRAARIGCAVVTASTGCNVCTGGWQRNAAVAIATHAMTRKLIASQSW